MVKNKQCPCGNKECDKELTSPGLEIKDTLLLSNKEHSLIHKRNYTEMWFDQYNHTMEFTRTLIQSIALILQLVILWKLFS